MNFSSFRKQKSDTTKGETVGSVPSGRKKFYFIGVVIVLVLIVRITTLEEFSVHGDSMSPTLNSTNKVVVNKRNTSPDKGQIIVFSVPKSAKKKIDSPLIKRVIGMPGSLVEIKNDSVFVNGKKLDEPYLVAGTETKGTVSVDHCVNKDQPFFRTKASDRSCIVPSGYYFVLGDNRTASTDSRSLGLIPQKNIIGVVVGKIWPLSDIEFL